MTDAVHPRNLPPCDLVMKGGVTSGVVYPAAVVELSRRYRFVRLGGTSAGAIAAAVSAAAEYARQRRGDLELRGIDPVVRDLGRPGFFLSLFAPTEEARPLFALLLALTRAHGSRRRQSAALARAAVAYRPWPAAVALLVLAGLLVLLLSGFRHLALPLAAVLTVLAATVLLMLAAAVVGGPLVALARTVHRGLDARGFGLSTGMASRPGQPAALTQWLHARIQEAAELPADRPLTFAMLAEAGITLQMVATDLGLARPVTIPFESEQYLFSPADLAGLFPEAVSDHILATAGVPAGERTSRRTWFMPAAELPVVVGARLSASVPLLLSSLQLYTAHAEAAGPAVSHLTDGALTSNFPIHFFDRWLPEHPTFGLDLVTAPAEASADLPLVHLPAGDEAPRLAPSQGIESLGGFLGRLQEASRSWRDELQAQLPGFRDRVCQIRLRPSEGGFHLDADPAAVRALVDRGALAGQEILRTFDWERHRAGRAATLVALLRENFALLAGRASGAGAAEEIPAELRAIEALAEQAAVVLPADGGASPQGGAPEPTLGIGPRI